jgi:DNA polymerase III sliding clamp (beta) subunit (PCNA family)
MTEVTFETTALIDSIRKAERAAPNKGEAFDKAAGIVFDLYPSDGQAILRTTNLQVFYREWLTPLAISGEPAMWRIPSKVFASFITKLPIRTNSQVTMRQEGPALHVECGRAKAKFLMILTEYYPNWDSFEVTDSMESVVGLAARIGQVEWAADIRNHELGVRFTREGVMATDGRAFAYADLKFPSAPEEGIVIPARLLNGMLRPEQTVKIGVNRDYFVMMPDETTQIHAVRMGTKYPPIERAMIREWANTVEFRKADLIDMIQRAMSIIDAERMPNMLLYIGKEEIAVHVAEDERGHIGDILDVPNQALHKRVKYAFQPELFMNALNAAPNETVRLGYHVPHKFRAIYIDGGSGYEAWVGPRRPSDPAEIRVS